MLTINVGHYAGQTYRAETTTTTTTECGGQLSAVSVFPLQKCKISSQQRKVSVPFNNMLAHQEPFQLSLHCLEEKLMVHTGNMRPQTLLDKWETRKYEFTWQPKSPTNSSNTF